MTREPMSKEARILAGVRRARTLAEGKTDPAAKAATLLRGLDSVERIMAEPS